jgi:hypothetical protein
MTVDAVLWEGVTTAASPKMPDEPIAVLVGVAMTPLDVDSEWLALSKIFPAWFWVSAWQQGEAEADEDLAAGRVRFHEDSAAFLEFLDDLTEGA